MSVNASLLPQAHYAAESLPGPPRSAARPLKARLYRSIAAHGLPRLADRVVLTLDADCNVRIEGRVNSYYLKQMAQEIVAKDRRVASIDNQLRVDVPENAVPK